MAAPWIRRRGLQALLSLPTPILRALSGGAAVYRAGRTLDPRLQFLAEAWRRYPPLHALPLAQARAAFDEGVATVQGRLPRGVRTVALPVPGADGERPGRLYLPPRRSGAPVLVYAHSGGGVLGGLDTDHTFCGLLAEGTGAPVLAVDYRLAPEHRFPAGLDDLTAAYRWARDQAERFGTPAGRAAIGGASIGGNFATALCHRLKAAREPQPDLQLLLYPAVDLASETPSVALFGDLPPLTGEMMNWFLSQTVAAEANPADPELSPLRQGDLSDLAPALVAVAGFDPLADQGDEYARRLREGGVTVVWRRYDRLAHGFAACAGVVPGAQDACRDIAALAGEMLRG